MCSATTPVSWVAVVITVVLPVGFRRECPDRMVLPSPLPAQEGQAGDRGLTLLLGRLESGTVQTIMSIGDFARATHLSVKALRHYHEEALLEPAEVDPFSGYRRYDLAQ